MSIPIFLYHQIAVPPPRPMPYRSMFVRPAAFARQMAYLKLLGYQGLSLRDAMPYIKGHKRGKVVVITFDDGFANILHSAAPILNAYKFTATSFIVSNQIAGRNEWDLPLGIVETPCMDLRQINTWMTMGHEVGSHTLDHVRLSQMTNREAERQIVQSKQDLEAQLGVEIKSFAYPYGDESLLLRRIVRDAGYSWAVTVERGRVDENTDPFGLTRATIRRSDTLLQVTRYLL